MASFIILAGLAAALLLGGYSYFHKLTRGGGCCGELEANGDALRRAVWAAGYTVLGIEEQ